MSIIRSIKLVDNYAGDYSSSNTLYVTLSKTLNKKLMDRGIKSIYLFDVDNPENLKDTLQKIERGLSEETVNDPAKRWFKVSYKFIYKYLLAYNQFYNRFETIIENNREAVESFQVSKYTTNIIKDTLIILCKKYNIILKYNSESFIGFSDYSSFMPVDLPKISDADTNNIFIYIIALFYRFSKHDTFILPCSLNEKLPQNVNLLRVSFFSIFQKIKNLLFGNNNKKSSSNFSYIDFDSNYKKKYKLDFKHWNSFRDDQIKFIEKIINITLNEYSNEYLDIIKSKLKILFVISNTKKIIVDETTDILKRVMIITANEMRIKTEFLPHGIIYEDEHIIAIKSLTNKINVLAWNHNSREYFNENDIKSTAIQYPIFLAKNKYVTKKDLLILISGNRHSLNNYERTIATLQSGLPNNLSIDWKYHQLINKDEINVMKKQKYDMEKYFNIKINTIHPSVRLTSIIKNYKKLLFTTWTTGIFEAALLRIPFIIYTIEPYKINAFKNIKLPVAQTMEKCTELLMDNNVDYLDKIKETLLIQPKLVDYLRKQC